MDYEFAYGDNVPRKKTFEQWLDQFKIKKIIYEKGDSELSKNKVIPRKDIILCSTNNNFTQGLVPKGVTLINERMANHYSLHMGSRPKEENKVSLRISGIKKSIMADYKADYPNWSPRKNVIGLYFYMDGFSIVIFYQEGFTEPYPYEIINPLDSSNIQVALNESLSVYNVSGLEKGKSKAFLVSGHRSRLIELASFLYFDYYNNGNKLSTYNIERFMKIVNDNNYIFSNDYIEKLELGEIFISEDGVEIPILENFKSEWIFYRHNYNKWKDKIMELFPNEGDVLSNG